MSVTQQQILAVIAIFRAGRLKTLAQSGALGGRECRDGKVFVSINVERDR